MARGEEDFAKSGCAQQEITMLGKLRFDDLQSANHVEFQEELAHRGSRIGWREGGEGEEPLAHSSNLPTRAPPAILGREKSPALAGLFLCRTCFICENFEH